MPFRVDVLAIGLGAGLAALDEGFELGAAAGAARNQERRPDMAWVSEGARRGAGAGFVLVGRQLWRSECSARTGRLRQGGRRGRRGRVGQETKVRAPRGIKRTKTRGARET